MNTKRVEEKSGKKINVRFYFMLQGKKNFNDLFLLDIVHLSLLHILINRMVFINWTYEPSLPSKFQLR